jgi:hypothetical protein
MKLGLGRAGVHMLKVEVSKVTIATLVSHASA